MFNRFIEEEIDAHLKIMPVVLITGARQTGKTTLVRAISDERGYHFVTFDDEFTLSNAQDDPALWLSQMPKPLIIDEVQRVPEIFLPIKRDVDKKRESGKYLLTGSANPLLLPRLGDSLAGRMGCITMYPFSQGELNGTKERFIPHLFAKEFTPQKYPALSVDHFCTLLLTGGFPPVQEMEEKDSARWIHSYLQTMMERDVRDISNIEGLRDFPRLFRLLATRSGMLLNISDLARSLSMVNVTLNRYMRLLETLHFIYLLPAWYANLGKRLIKSPKMHVCDTAILAELLGADRERLAQQPQLLGQFLENFVFFELLKQKSWSPLSFHIFHFRDGDFEVDFVLERSDGTIIGVEVKSAKTLSSDDLRGLRHLKSLAKKKFHRGIILHFGTQVTPLGEDLWALPIQALWG